MHSLGFGSVGADLLWLRGSVEHPDGCLGEELSADAPDEVWVGVALLEGERERERKREEEHKYGKIQKLSLLVHSTQARFYTKHGVVFNLKTKALPTQT